MTAIVMLPCGDGIVVASDAAAYEPERGRLISLESKVVLAPEWSCVFAQRGAGGLNRMVRDNLAGLPIEGLDDVLVHLPNACRAAFLTLGTLHGAMPHFSLFTGGWSDERQRFEIHVIRSRSRPMDESDPCPPFTVRAIDGVVAPAADGASNARCGIDMEAILAGGQYGEPVQHFAVRAVCAARLSRNEPETGVDRAEFGVGGYLQLTLLTRSAVESSIVHRWPDPFGEPINPRRGEVLPDWLAARSRPSDRP